MQLSDLSKRLARLHRNLALGFSGEGMREGRDTAGDSHLFFCVGDPVKSAAQPDKPNTELESAYPPGHEENGLESEHTQHDTGMQ